MRKLYLCVLAAVLLLGCAKESEIGLGQYSEIKGFTASIESSSTRVHAEGLSIKWDDGDEIAVFDGTNKLKCTYSSARNFFDMNGEMPEWVSSVYAVYPHSSEIGVVDGKISVVLPCKQSYYENSFGAGANIMVAQITGDNILFRNVGAYLKLNLYGNDVAVKSIRLEGNSGEQLSGTALVSFDENGVPKYEWDESITGTILELECNNGVQLGSTSEEATPFWIVVPPQVFENGITVTVIDINGKEFVKSTSNSIPLERNYIQPMAPFEYLAPLEIICSAGDMQIPLPINGDSKSISVGNFLPIDIDLETFEPTGDNLEYRAMIESIVIPDGITSVDAAAFAFCTSLTSVTIPETVKTIGLGAFAGCESLTNVNIPESVEIIGDMAFAKSGLEEVTIPESVERLGMGVFAETKLTSIAIPDNITGSLSSTFSGCTSLENVTLSANVVELGNCAFYGCTSLQSINIPANVEEIEEGVFEGCTNLINVSFDVNSKLRLIWNDSFRNCTSLESITLPASLGGNSGAHDSFVGSSDIADAGVGVPVLGTARGLGNSVFAGCGNLTVIYSLSENPLELDYNTDLDSYPFPFNNTGFKVCVPSEEARGAYVYNQHWGGVMGADCIVVDNR